MLLFRYDRKKPMEYSMGGGNVIKGCEIGTMNMCVGEKRHLVIPPHLAYGNETYGQIPPSMLT
jgi:FK506-binding protein 2